jgi:DNA polymerase III epsilon subunit-like protein
MRVLVIDTETSGLDATKHQVLQIGALIYNTKTDEVESKYDMYVRHENIVADIETIFFHISTGFWDAYIEATQDEDGNFDSLVGSPAEVVEGFKAWLDANDLGGRVYASGKNVASFDIPFLKALGIHRFKHRTLDLGSIMFNPEDDDIPNLKECKERCGLEGEVTHFALDDCYDVVNCLRSYYGKI